MNRKTVRSVSLVKGSWDSKTACWIWRTKGWRYHMTPFRRINRSFQERPPGDREAWEQSRCPETLSPVLEPEEERLPLPNRIRKPLFHNPWCHDQGFETSFKNLFKFVQNSVFYLTSEASFFVFVLTSSENMLLLLVKLSFWKRPLLSPHPLTHCLNPLKQILTSRLIL